jgi:hypothetical protein
MQTAPSSAAADAASAAAGGGVARSRRGSITHRALDWYNSFQ